MKTKKNERKRYEWSMNFYDDFRTLCECIDKADVIAARLPEGQEVNIYLDQETNALFERHWNKPEMGEAIPISSIALYFDLDTEDEIERLRALVGAVKGGMVNDLNDEAGR